MNEWKLMYLDYVESPVGLLKIEATEDQMVALRLVREKEERVFRNRVTEKAKAQLEEYFLGKRTDFDLPLKTNGTKLQEAVWQALRAIPYGQTCSYSRIAAIVGRPKAHRAVGSANRLNLLPIIIPCHRVIAKDGKLAGYALGVDKKAWLLRHEQTR